MGAERECESGGLTTGSAGVPGPRRPLLMEEPSALDLSTDAHVHTGFAAGRDSVGVVVTAADRAGLRAVTFADQVGPDTAWLPAYADAVRRAQQRTELRLRIAAEIEVVRPDGWLAWPSDLADLDAVSVAVSRLPLESGPAEPRQVRALLAAGVLTRGEVAETVVAATIRAVERVTRYAPAQLARPLALLAEVGIDEDEVSPALLADLVEGCRVTNTTVEVSEAWRTPSARQVHRFLAAGVPVAAASDARYAVEVGRWRYLRQICGG